MSEAGAAALVVAILGSTGLVGGIVALLRVRPESGKLIVEAAEGAVVVQGGVITELRRELNSLREALELERDERDECATRCTDLERKVRDLEEVLRRHGINGEPARRPPAAPPSAA